MYYEGVISFVNFAKKLGKYHNLSRKRKGRVQTFHGKNDTSPRDLERPHMSIVLSVSDIDFDGYISMLTMVI